jgi:hypothetical protein
VLGGVLFCASVASTEPAASGAVSGAVSGAASGAVSGALSKIPSSADKNSFSFVTSSGLSNTTVAPCRWK